MVCVCVLMCACVWGVSGSGGGGGGGGVNELGTSVVFTMWSIIPLSPNHLADITSIPPPPPPRLILPVWGERSVGNLLCKFYSLKTHLLLVNTFYQFNRNNERSLINTNIVKMYSFVNYIINKVLKRRRLL